MSSDRVNDDGVVEVNFGAGTLREGAPRRAAAPRPAPGSLLDALRVLGRWRWTIVGVTAAVLALAAAYLFLATPAYRAALVLQMEDRRPTLTGLEDLAGFIGEAASPAETEIEIIRSRTLIGTVVDELGLDVHVEPLHAPLVGDALARRWQGAGLAPPRFGLARYAWGGERIRVRQLHVADELVDQPLVLTALEGGRYRITNPAGAVLVEGTAGTPAAGGEGPSHVELVVAELAARPGTEFVLVLLDRSGVVSSLVRSLTVRETGKKTNIMVAELEGADPQEVASTLNALGRAYLRRNVNQKSAETAQMLAFLESQLPGLKANLEKAEAALNAFQRDKRSVNISQEAEAVLGRSVRIETTLQDLQLQLTDLRQRFTESHPTVVALQQKIARVQAERAALDGELSGLPARELDSARLSRDVKVASELYVLVLNKAQELAVARSGVVGNVAIVDAAEPPQQPTTKPPVVLGLSLLLGLGLGVAVAFARNAFDDGADDPDEIEARTGLPVFVTVAHSDAEARLEHGARLSPDGARSTLADVARSDAAVEDLRRLRTALQFALLQASTNVVAIGAPAPSAGKSFVSVNLACLLAGAGRRVLLMDADLRRGQLHRYFSLERGPGLCEVLGGALRIDEALRHTRFERLDVLTTGSVTQNPAELLANRRFPELLAAVSARYDVVLVDTPPVLAVADSALVAQHAGVNLLVLRAGAHSMQEIALAAKQLAQAGARTQGAVLNDVRSSRGPYGRSGRYYRYVSEADEGPRAGFFRRERR